MKSIITLLAAVALLSPGCANDDDRPVKSPIGPETDFYGVVADNHGRPLQGVVVSDGYSCTATNENGVYQLTGCEHSYQIYVSVPAEYEIPLGEGLPRFWQQIAAGRKRYDFTLTPLAGGKESAFNLFCVADPQCQNNSHIARFENETVPDIAGQAAASDLPCYGITLGDIGYNTANTDYTNAVFPLMKRAMQAQKTGLPLFQLMGNHDDYALGFRDDQVAWLAADLSFVPKEKMVILCTHMPLRDGTAQNVQAVLDLLEGYAEVHVMTGHTHYAENLIYADRHPGIYEHVHGAVCGAWWQSTINTDGTPNGYAVYRIEGPSIASWKYKGTGLDIGCQIRLYRAGDLFMEGYTPNYRFSYAEEGQIVANVWNADETWKIEVYENGVRTGEMEPFGDDATKRDAWASGYHCGVLGRNPDNYDRTNTSHLFHYTLRNPSAETEVRATDPFGNVYTQSHLTTGSAADYPAYE